MSQPATHGRFAVPLRGGQRVAAVSSLHVNEPKTARMQGKVAIVTGGGWNIGRAVAVWLAREGAAVAVFGRRQELLDETVQIIESHGGRGLAVAGDVTVLADCERLAEQTRRTLGPVDCLAAIAGGGGGYQELDAIDPQLWAQIIQLNLVGTFHSVRAVLPEMRQRRRGTIVTACGGGGWFPTLELPMTAYATAKAGICRFTDQLAVELLQTGIRVNCMQPGQVWGPDKVAQVAVEEQRNGQPHPGRADNHPPEHAAELTAFLLSDESAPLTGRIASVDEDWWRDRAQVEAVCQSLHAYCLRRVDG